MKRWMTLSIALSLVLTLWSGPVVQAQDAADEPVVPAFVDENGDGIDDNVTFRHRFGRRHKRGGRMGSLLTEEQRTALKGKIDALKAEGATKEEIRAAIDAEMEALGVEGQSRGFGRKGSLLTEEQRTALKEKIDALKAEDVTKEEIRAAVNAEMEALGVEGQSRGFGRKGSLLTEEQRTALKEKIDALKAGDATKDEIRTEIKAEMEALGVEAPSKGFGRKGSGRRGGFGHRGGFRGHGGRRGGPGADTGDTGDSDSGNTSDAQ